MNKGDVMVSIKKLNETVRHQQGVMSPDSNGQGHGRLLQTIAANPGISGVELALRMDMSASVISEKLSGLEEQEMIYRERDQKDRRRTHIYITNDGTMALARREFGQKRFEECIRECLSEEERAAFCDMCERIIQSIQKMAEADAEPDEVIISFYEQQKKRRAAKQSGQDEEKAT